MELEPKGPAEDRNAEFARMYGDSIREALENMDKISQQAQKMHEQAIDEINATREARKKIEDSADEIAKEVLEKRRKEMEKDLRTSIEKKLVVKLLYAGRTSAEISEWLDIPIELIADQQRILHNPASVFMDAMVNVTQTGRGGTVIFIQGDKQLHFYWEFGGGPTLALIMVPNEAQWEAQTGYPLNKRMDILHWVAQQVIYQKSSSSDYRILNDVIEVY